MTKKFNNKILWILFVLILLFPALKYVLKRGSKGSNYKKPPVGRGAGSDASPGLTGNQLSNDKKNEGEITIDGHTVLIKEEPKDNVKETKRNLNHKKTRSKDVDITKEGMNTTSNSTKKKKVQQNHKLLDGNHQNGSTKTHNYSNRTQNKENDNVNGATDVENLKKNVNEPFCGPDFNAQNGTTAAFSENLNSNSPRHKKDNAEHSNIIKGSKKKETETIKSNSKDHNNSDNVVVSTPAKPTRKISPLNVNLYSSQDHLDRKSIEHKQEIHKNGDTNASEQDALNAVEGGNVKDKLNVSELININEGEKSENTTKPLSPAQSNAIYKLTNTITRLMTAFHILAEDEELLNRILNLRRQFQRKPFIFHTNLETIQEVPSDEENSQNEMDANDIFVIGSSAEISKTLQKLKETESALKQLNDSTENRAHDTHLLRNLRLTNDQIIRYCYRLVPHILEIIDGVTSSFRGAPAEGSFWRAIENFQNSDLGGQPVTRYQIVDYFLMLIYHNINTSKRFEFIEGYKNLLEQSGFAFELQDFIDCSQLSPLVNLFRILIFDYKRSEAKPYSNNIDNSFFDSQTSTAVFSPGGVTSDVSDYEKDLF